jgi:hypothetical protein
MSHHFQVERIFAISNESISLIKKRGQAPFFNKKQNHSTKIVDWYTPKFLELAAQTNIILKNYGEGRFRVTLQMSPITPVS